MYYEKPRHWRRRRKSKQNGTKLERLVTMLGVAVCACALKLLVGGGIVTHLETKDCGFVTLFSFLAFSRCWCYWWPPAHRSFTETTQSLLACYFSRPCNKILFYGSKVLFAMCSFVLAIMRLVSQDFGKKEVANIGFRDFALNVFYGLTLVEALSFLIALILSLLRKKRNSMGLADVPKVDLEKGQGGVPRNGSVGREHRREIPKSGDGEDGSDEDGPGGETGNGSVGRQHRREIPKSGDGEDGSDEDGPGGEPGDGPGDGPEDGPEDGPGGGPGDGPGDGPVNQSNECNRVAPMDRPANQSNDFNSEPADSLPKLRQRVLKNEVLLLMSKADPQARTFYEHQSTLNVIREKPMQEIKSDTGSTYTTNTSLVATLIATVTFAAAFTFPGGTEKGLPIMGRKPAFKAFLISDTLAMCSSLAVAFLCILARWKDRKFLLSYRSFTRKLMWFALIATTVAFATGLYTVVAPHFLWLAILICFLSLPLPFLAYLLSEWPTMPLQYPRDFVTETEPFWTKIRTWIRIRNDRVASAIRRASA